MSRHIFPRQTCTVSLAENPDSVDVRTGTQISVDIGGNAVELASGGVWVRDGREEINSYLNQAIKPQMQGIVSDFNQSASNREAAFNENAATRESALAQIFESTVCEAANAAQSAVVAHEQALNAGTSASSAATSAEAANTAKTQASGFAATAQGYAFEVAASATAASTSAANAAAGAISAQTFAGQAASSAQEAQIANKITNCLTKIPQDIQLELNNGTLTLKAGSKSYLLNGNFTPVTTAADSSRKPAVTGKLLMFINSSGVMAEYFADRYFSGATAPTSGIGSTWLWLDTTSNQLKRTMDGGTSWNNLVYSLPIAVVTCDATAGVTSIDQIFNGFGYFGSTIFALPGVEGLIPNGRNEDGSLKNTLFKNTAVLLFTPTSALWGNRYRLRCQSNYLNLFVFSTYYDQENNLIIYNNAKQNQGFYGYVSIGSDGRITELDATRVICLPDGRAVNDRLSVLEDTSVTTDTSQTITETKKFTKTILVNHQITISNEEIAYAETPTNTVADELVFKDKNNQAYGSFKCALSPQGANFAQMLVRGKDGAYTALELGKNSDGSAYTSCPASDTVHSILTTTGITKAQNGYVKLGNGIIIQWGTLSISASNTPVTFPLPFTSEPFYIGVSGVENTANNYSTGCVISNSLTATGCTVTQINKDGNRLTGTVKWLAIGY